MELNDKVRVILTERGAKVLNENNALMRLLYPKMSWKTDYKVDEAYQCLLWQLFEHFGSSDNAGSEATFTNLQPVDRGRTPDRDLMGDMKPDAY